MRFRKRSNLPPKRINANIRIAMANPISSAVKKNGRLDDFDPLRSPERACRIFAKIGFATLLTSCAAYGPYHVNTPSEPLKSVRGPADGRYKLAFVEFGDQGSALDTSQRTAALKVIHESEPPCVHTSLNIPKQLLRRSTSPTLLPRQVRCWCGYTPVA